MFNSTTELYYISKPPHPHKRLKREPSGIFKRGLIRSLIIRDQNLLCYWCLTGEQHFLHRTAAQSYPFVSS